MVKYSKTLWLHEANERKLFELSLPAAAKNLGKKEAKIEKGSINELVFHRNTSKPLLQPFSSIFNMSSIFIIFFLAKKKKRETKSNHNQ